ENDLSRLLLLLEDLGGAGGNLGGYAEDRLELRIGLEDGFGLVDRLGEVAALVHDVEDLHLGRSLGHGVLETLGAKIEVGGAQAALHDYKIALALHEIGHLLRRGGARGLVVGADVGQGFRGGGGSIEGDNLDARLHRVVDDRHEAGVVVGGDGDAVDLLGDQILDHLGLERHVELLRIDFEGLDAVLGTRVLEAREAGNVVGVDALGDHDEGLYLRLRRRAGAEAHRDDRRGDKNEQCLSHTLPPNAILDGLSALFEPIASFHRTPYAP